MSDRFKWLEMSDDSSRKDKGKQIIEPDSYDHAIRNGFYLIVKGDLEDALKYYSRALDYDQTQSEPWLKQIWILIQLNEIAQALTWSKAGLQKFPQDPELLSIRAFIAAISADFSTAMAYSDNANSKKGISPLTQIIRGAILMLRGGRAGERTGERCILKGLEGNQNDWWLQINAALAYLEAGFTFNAIEHLNLAKTLQKNSPFIYYLLSKTYKSMGDLKRARKMIENSLAIDPYFELGIDYQEELGNRISISDWFKSKFRKKKL